MDLPTELSLVLVELPAGGDINPTIDLSFCRWGDASS
jgi:hypothetical protein